MLPPTLFVQCLLLLSLGSPTIGTPIIPKIATNQLNSHLVPRDAEPVTGNPNHISSDSKRQTNQGISTVSSLIPTGPGSSGSVTLSPDAAKGLSLHNAARATKGLPALVWDISLEAQASAYAKQLALLGFGSLTHSLPFTRPNQGENLGWIGTTMIFSNNVKNPIESITNLWVSEAPNYHGEVLPNGNFSTYNHYTQIMWNTTTKVGIAAASPLWGGWYVVARYSPAGNVYGQKPF